MAQRRDSTHETEAGRRARRRSLPPLLALALAGALLLIGAPAAPGFGFITKWSNKGPHEKQVKPTGVATGASGSVYVVGDYFEVQKFTPRGTLIAEWLPRGLDQIRQRAPGGNICAPSSVATDRAEHVYITIGCDSHLIQKFTANGRFLGQWRARGAEEPGSIEVDRAGNVYLSAIKWIEKFTSNGTFVTQWRDSGPGGLDFDATVHALATDAADNVYALGGARVTKFTSDGSFIEAWGKDIGGPGVNVCTVTCSPVRQTGSGTDLDPYEFSLSGGGGLVVDDFGHVFASDGYVHRVQEFTTDGAFLGEFGGFGGANGQLRSPIGLATNARDDLYVADKNNHRIQKFGEPSSAFSFEKKVTTNARTGTAQLAVNLPGVGQLSVAGPQVKSASRVAKGAGKLALPVNPTGAARERLEATGRAAVRVQVTYTSTTPGPPTSATRSKRVTLIQLPNLTTATFDGSSLLVRLQCPASFKPLCAGRAMAVTARDRCERRNGRRICHPGAAMTSSAPLRLRPTESKVVKLRVRSEFRREVARLARHPGAKSLLIRQLIHAKGFKHGRPQAVFHTYKVQAGK